MEQKNGIIPNISWSFAERLLAQGVGLIVMVILARLLAPEYYGTIALVSVFITICNVFVISGIGVSLIQDKDAEQADFSTVFYLSAAVGLLLYALLFFAAPSIGRFYKDETLIPVIRVLSLKLPIAGVSTIQRAYVSRHMQFKKLFCSTLGSSLVSGGIGVLLAYMGFGVWALVAQELFKELAIAIVLFFVVNWRPERLFSLERARKHFRYSWKVTSVDLLTNVFAQMRTALIGKLYTVGDVAFYNQGQKYPDYVISNISTSICNVLFPAIADYGDDMLRVKRLMRKAIKTSSFLITPLMIGLAVTAVPFVRLLFTDKWLPCVPYMRIICLIYVMMPINAINIAATKAIGRSDALLKMQLVKVAVSGVILLLAATRGMMAIAYSGLIDNLFTCAINIYPCKKFVDYGTMEQIQDMMPAILLSGCMAVTVYLAMRIPFSSNLLAFMVPVMIGMAVYIGLALLFRAESMFYLLQIIKGFLKGRRA